MLLQRSLVQFIEALAIADARRDHLALSAPTVPQKTRERTRTLPAGGSTNEARGHLRKVFD
jgi:hypothetical protein